MVNRTGIQGLRDVDFLRHRAGVQLVIHGEVGSVAVFDETDGCSAGTQLPEG